MILVELYGHGKKRDLFNLLNKYKTITAILNNQQDWLAFLPKKSMIQIITYYELLKNNYKTLQRQQQNKTKTKTKRYRKNKKGKSKRGMEMEMESHLC